MPAGIGYGKKLSRAEREAIKRRQKSAGNVLGAVGSSLKQSAVVNAPSARSVAERKRLAERAKVDAAVTGRSSRPPARQAPKTEREIRNENAARRRGDLVPPGSAIGRLTDALTPKLKRKKRR